MASSRSEFATASKGVSTQRSRDQTVMGSTRRVHGRREGRFPTVVPAVSCGDRVIPPPYACQVFPRARHQDLSPSFPHVRPLPEPWISPTIVVIFLFRSPASIGEIGTRMQQRCRGPLSTGPGPRGSGVTGACRGAPRLHDGQGRPFRRIGGGSR